MRIFKSFCENNSGKERILQEYTEKGSLFGEPSFLSLLSFDFYLYLLSFYPSISIFVVLVFLTILSRSALRVSPSAYRLCRGSASDG